MPILLRRRIPPRSLKKMEERFRKALLSSPEEFFALIEKQQTRSDKSCLKTLVSTIARSKQAVRLPAKFWDALSLHTSTAVFAFENPATSSDENPAAEVKTPSPRKKRRRRISPRSPAPDECYAAEAKAKALNKVRAYAHLTYLFVSNYNGLGFNPMDLFPTVQALHDKLVLFESDANLQDCITVICEQWWKDSLPGRESFIAQSLPCLLSKSLSFGRKVDVHRVYAIRDAFTYLDFMDESIEDLKHLLLRSVVTPVYLRTEEGRRFLAFLFGLNIQLVKELIAIIRSQIPFGQNSILEAYGEILYKAWRVSKGPSLDEIEKNCIQGLIEAAVHAASRSLAASIRKVLGAFINQRTQDGVESFLYQLQEPILFRSLQAANSNVRRNALLLLVDMFPLEDPNASKEEKESLLERQFFLLDKLLLDDCPDVRSVTVEGVCRILRLFWEVVPCHIAAKLLSKIVDEMAKDVTSSAVRSAVVNGMIYLLDNPQTHDMLKMLLPRLGKLFDDPAPTVRVLVADLLLTLKDIRELQFHKVVDLDSILCALETDQLPVAQKLTRLLMPTYFPSKLPVSEACVRFFSLVKRTPYGAARFCECAPSAGTSHKLLVELVKFLSDLIMTTSDLDPKVKEGILLSISKLCSGLASNQASKAALQKVFSMEKLKCILSYANSSSAYTDVLHISTIMPADEVSELVEQCSQIIMDFNAVIQNKLKPEEVKVAYKLVHACGALDGLIITLSKILEAACSSNDSQDTQNEEQRQNKDGIQNSKGKRKRKKPLKIANECMISSVTQIPESGNVHNEVSFANATVAAWHIENLLSEESTRKALLGFSKSQLLVSGLKSVAEMTLHHSKLFSFRTILSPIQAYLSLITHLTYKRKSMTEKSTAKNKKNQHSINDTLVEMFSWAELCIKSSDETDTPVKTSAVKKKRKRSIGLSSKSKRRLPMDEDLSETDTSRKSNTKSISNTSMLPMIAAVILKSASDAFTLQLIELDSVYDKCIEFASFSLRYINTEIEKLIDSQKRMGSEWKQFIGCTRSCITYAANIVHFCLRKSVELAPLAFKLANNVIDLIVLIDSAIGPRCSLPVLKLLEPWMPDLVIALSSSANSLCNNENFDYFRCRMDFDDLAEEGKLSSYAWLRALALGSAEIGSHDTACSQEDTVDDHEMGEASKDKTEVPNEKLNSAINDFMKTLTRLLHKGDDRLLQAFSIMLLSQVAFLLRAKDYSKATGLLNFVCAKLLEQKHSNSHNSVIDLNECLLHSFKMIEGHLVMVSESLKGNQDDEKLLEIAKMHIATVLSSRKM